MNSVTLAFDAKATQEGMSAALASLNATKTSFYPSIIGIFMTQPHSSMTVFA
jgi:hypothetical protein